MVEKINNIMLDTTDLRALFPGLLDQNRYPIHALMSKSSTVYLFLFVTEIFKVQSKIGWSDGVCVGIELGLVFRYLFCVSTLCTLTLQDTPTPSTTETFGSVSLWNALRRCGLSPEACDIIMQGWSEGTKEQYHTYISRWARYCDRRHVGPYSPAVLEVIEFLRGLVKKKLRYSTINTARAAVMNLVLCSGGELTNTGLLDKFMKGVAALRPSGPRYMNIWDPQPLLDYIKGLGPNEALPLSVLTRKLVSLAGLVTGQRAQTLHNLTLENMTKTSHCACFLVTAKLKTSGPKSPRTLVHLPHYHDDPSLCVLSCLRVYLCRTKHLHKKKQGPLFLITRQPFTPATRDSVKRWIKDTMKAAGINTKMFTAHSVRAASTFKAARSVPLATIMRAAGCRQESTFARHYHRQTVDHQAFATAVLAKDVATEHVN